MQKLETAYFFKVSLRIYQVWFVCLFVCSKVSARQSLASTACAGRWNATATARALCHPHRKVAGATILAALSQFNPNTNNSCTLIPLIAEHGRVGRRSLKSSRSFAIDRVRTHDRPKSIARSARIDPTPHLEVTSAKNANQRDLRASADAEKANNDLPRAPRPQEIL